MPCPVTPRSNCELTSCVLCCSIGSAHPPAIAAARRSRAFIFLEYGQAKSLQENGGGERADRRQNGAMIESDLLLHGYRLGVFPMAMEDESIEWFSPDPRGIIPLDGFHLPHAARRAWEQPRRAKHRARP